MKKVLDSIIESIPLTLFLIYIHLHEMKNVEDWLAPYAIGAAGGILTIAYLYSRAMVLNRLFLGITLYFCSGVLSVAFNWDWMNQTYGQIGAAGLLFWILFIGLITGIFSANGFVGKKTPPLFSLNQHLSIDAGSLALLLITLSTTFMALYFRHHLLLGEWLPFIILFTTRSLLLRKKWQLSPTQ